MPSVERGPEGARSRAAIRTRGVDRLALVSGLALVGIVAVAGIICLAAVKRGLDLSDESFYIFSEEHARQNLRFYSEFPLLLGPILSLVRHVWLLRVVKLMSLVGANVFFAWSFLKTAPSLMGARFNRFDQLAVGAVVVAGGLGLYVYNPQTPGYNDLTALIVVLISGLLLLLADQRIPRRWEPAFWSVFGALLWFQLLVKWPATVAISLLVVLALLQPRSRLWDVTKRVLASVLGAALGAVFTQLFLAPVPAIATRIQGNSEHRPGALVGQYLSDVSNLAHVIMHDFWYLLVAALVMGVLIGTRGGARTASVICGLGLVCLTPAFVLSGRARGGLTLPWSSTLSRSAILPLYVVLSLLVTIPVITIRRKARPSLKGVLIVAWFLAMPFLIAFGTANHIWLNASFMPQFWIAAALAITAMANGDEGRPLVHGLAFAFAALVAFTAFDGTWIHPYQQRPLSADSVEVNIPGPLNGLRVDQATADFLEQVHGQVVSLDSTKLTMVVWSGLGPGASVAGGVTQPLYAWLALVPQALSSLAAACREHQDGILLLGFPGTLQSIAGDPALALACSGRTWTERPSVMQPYSFPPYPLNDVAVWFSGPVH